MLTSPELWTRSLQTPRLSAFILVLEGVRLASDGNKKSVLPLWLFGRRCGKVGIHVSRVNLSGKKQRLTHPNFKHLVV